MNARRYANIIKNILNKKQIAYEPMGVLNEHGTAFSITLSDGTKGFISCDDNFQTHDIWTISISFPIADISHLSKEDLLILFLIGEEMFGPQMVPVELQPGNWWLFVQLKTLADCFEADQYDPFSALVNEISLFWPKMKDILE